MPKSVRVYKVFLASPYDLRPERALVRGIVRGLNNRLRVMDDSQIEIVGGDDVDPEFGRPQEIINRELYDSDLIFCMLWKRIGSPASTGSSKTGFEEEFALARELYEKRRKGGGPPLQVVLLFKKVAKELLADPDPQLQGVIRFQREVEQSQDILYAEFDDDASLVAKATPVIARVIPESDRNPAELPPIAGNNLSLGGLAPSFFGRQPEMEKALELLDRNSLVTIAGQSGLGKTRLARALDGPASAKPWAAGGRHFVPVEEIGKVDDTETALWDLIAATLFNTRDRPRNAREAVVRALASGPRLLVLDNCETVSGGGVQVVRHLLQQCRDLKILATSQRPLGLQRIEAVMELGGLDIPKENGTSGRPQAETAGYQLFVARVGLEKPGWQPATEEMDVVRRILECTEGLPLAIELVALWVPYKKLETIAKSLEETPFGEFTTCLPAEGSDPGDIPARHKSLARCLSWTFACYSERERDLLEQLSIFAGPFTEEAAQRVCGMDAQEKLLISLQKARSIEQVPHSNPTRFKIARFRQAYAAGRARIRGLQGDLAQQHLEYFLQRAQTAKGTRPFEPDDVPDLVAALEQARATKSLDALLLLSKITGPLLMERGRWIERERTLRSLVPVLDAAGRWGALNHVLLDLGNLLEDRGAMTEAEGCYQRASDFARKDKRHHYGRQARALQHLFTLRCRMGRTADAKADLKELQRILSFGQIQDNQLKAGIWEGVARGHESGGALAEAEQAFRKAVATLGNAGKSFMLARIQTGLARILTKQGNFTEARELLEEARQLTEGSDARRERGHVDFQMAQLAHASGRHAEAVSLQRRTIAGREGSPKEKAVALVGLARQLRHHREKWAEAEAAIDESLRLVRTTIPDKRQEALTLCELGTLRATQRRDAEAVDCFRLSCTLYDNHVPEDIRSRAIAWERLGDTLRRQGSKEDALAAYEKSEQIAGANPGLGQQRALNLLKLAELRISMGRPQQALAHVETGITLLGTTAGTPGTAELAADLKKLRRVLESLPSGASTDDIQIQFGYVPARVEIRSMFGDERHQKNWRLLADRYHAYAVEQTLAGDTVRTTIAWSEVGSALRKAGAPEEAIRALGRSLKSFRQLRLVAGEASCWHKLGKQQATRKRWSGAERCLRKAIDLQRRQENEIGEAISLDQLAQLLLEQGKVTASEETVDQAIAILKHSGTDRQREHLFKTKANILGRKGPPAAREDFLTEMSTLFPSMEDTLKKLRRIWQAPTR